MPSPAPDALVCYSVKANSNLAVLATLAGSAPAWTWCRRASFAARSPRASRLSRSPSPASARPRDEMAFALDAGIFAFNVESEPELQSVERGGLVARGATARIALPRQSRRRRQDPPQDRHRQGREQVRRSVRRGACALCAGAAAARRRSAGVHMHIGSQITDLAPFRNAFALLKELVAELRGQRLRHRLRQSRRRPRRALSQRRAGAAASRPNMRKLVRETVGDLGLQAPVRAWAHDRRQCRHPRLPRALCEARAPTRPSPSSMRR